MICVGHTWNPDLNPLYFHVWALLRKGLTNLGVTTSTRSLLFLPFTKLQKPFKIYSLFYSKRACERFGTRFDCLVALNKHDHEEGKSSHSICKTFYWKVCFYLGIALETKYRKKFQFKRHTLYANRQQRCGNINKLTDKLAATICSNRNSVSSRSQFVDSCFTRK